MNILLHKEKKGKPDSLSGFTMIELVAVLIVVAVLAATVMFSVAPDQESLSSALNTFRSNLRYAQSLAMGQSHLLDEDPSDNTVIWGLSWGGSTYQLQVQGASQDYIKLPGSDSATITLPGTVQFGSSGSIHFNYRGEPVSTSESALSNDTSITLTQGTLSQAVTVVAETGFVQ